MVRTIPPHIVIPVVPRMGKLLKEKFDDKRPPDLPPLKLHPAEIAANTVKSKSS